MLRLGVAALLAGVLFTLQGGVSPVTVGLVVVGLVLVAARGWDRRHPTRP